MTAIIITGANGYIGRAIVAAAQQAGHDVYALARHDDFGPDVNYIPYDLVKPIPADLPQDAAIIHLAYMTRDDASQPDRNHAAIKRWLAHATENNNRFIFISSQTARADAPTLYGYDKWRAEQEVTAAGGIIVRPGMVYGGAPAGLFGVMSKLVQYLPILPAFRPAPRVQPVHVDDLAQALVTIATMEEPKADYNIASATPISFTDFLRQLARDIGKQRLFCPLPVSFIQPIFSTARYMPAFLKARLQSLHSLFDLPAMDVSADFDHRPFIKMDDALLYEAKAIFNHVVGTTNEAWVAAYRARFTAPPQKLPHLLSIKSNDPYYRPRLLAALEIAQADPQAAYLFYDKTIITRLRSLLLLPAVFIQALLGMLAAKVRR